jgi:hypothetical protein
VFGKVRRRHRTSSIASRRSPPARPGFHQDVPREDVVIRKAEEIAG